MLAVRALSAEGDEAAVSHEVEVITILGTDLLADVPGQGGGVAAAIAAVALTTVELSLGLSDLVAGDKENNQTNSDVVKATKEAVIEVCHAS